jgi:hypothetical protein
MYGKTRGLAHHVCAPKKGYVPEGHPVAGSFWTREDAIVDELNEFLSAPHLRHLSPQFARWRHPRHW